MCHTGVVAGSQAYACNFRETEIDQQRTDPASLLIHGTSDVVSESISEARAHTQMPSHAAA